MTDYTKWVGFDVETAGELPEYALQPYRLTLGQASVTSFAAAWFDPDNPDRLVTKAVAEPTVEDYRQLLNMAYEQGLTLVGWNVAFDAAWLVAAGLREEVLRCDWLDGMLLWQHLEREPEYEMSAAARRPWGLKAAVEKYYPVAAGYDEGVDFQDMSPEAVAKRLTYNRMDAQFALALARSFHQQLRERSTRQLRNAMIERAAIPMVADSMVQGLVVDRDAAEDLGQELQALTGDLLKQLEAEGATDKVLRSPVQLRKLLYETWGMPIEHYTNKGAPSTDKVALHYLSLDDPRPQLVKDYREALGNYKKFVENVVASADYNEDGKTRPAMRIYGTYCVDGETEVLTPTGWEPISSWQGGPIAQVDPDTRTTKFIEATRYLGPVVDDWVVTQTRGLNMCLTLGHTVPYIAQNGEWATTKGQHLLTVGNTALPVAAPLAEAAVCYTDTTARVLTMFQADGYYEPKRRRIKFTFSKQRKIARCKRLLTQAEIPFNEYVCAAYPDRTEISVGTRSAPAWLSADKKDLVTWAWGCRPAVVADEARHWDGSEYSYGYKVTFASRSNAEVYHTLCALAGLKAAVHADEAQKHGGTTTTVYVSTVSRPVRTVHRQHSRLERGPKWSYCPETTTGFWLARRAGTIFITGNTGRATFASKQGRGKAERQTGFAIHQMKNDKRYRNIIAAPEGFVLCELDAAGQEFRWMAEESGDETMRSLCMPGEDPHSYMGASIIHMDYHRMMELKEIDDEAKHGRKMGKVANLSNQFRIGWKKLRLQANVQFGMPIGEREAQHIHKTYHSTYPGVKQYWNRQTAKCRRLGYAETLAGRRVQLKGSWTSQKTGWKLESTAVNFPIQGIGADQKYLAIKVMSNLLPQMGGYFYFELHDGIYFLLPGKTARRDALVLQQALNNLPYQRAWGFTPSIPFPWDLKIGTSWGSMKEVHE